MSPLARRTQRSLDRLFVEPRPSIETARLFSHIGRSPEVFAQYQARVALERALCRTSEGQPTVFSHQRVQAGITAALAMQRSTKRHRVWLFSSGALAAAACAVLLAIALRVPQGGLPLPDDAALSEIAGGAGAHPTAAVGIRVFRVGGTAADAAAVDAAAVDEPNSLDGGVLRQRGGVLHNGDQITFTFTSMHGEYRYLALIGQHNNNRAVTWYYPGPDGQGSITIPTGAPDTPLGDGFLVADSHRPGSLWLTGLFSREPLLTREVEEVLHKSGGMELSAHNWTEDFAANRGVIAHQIRLEIEPSSRHSGDSP